VQTEGELKKISFSSADKFENLLRYTEIYINELTVQLALRIKYLYCYSNCVFYITAVHSVVSRNTIFHKKSSISVQVSFM